jgi:hypothetical protein
VVILTKLLGLVDWWVDRRQEEERRVEASITVVKKQFK